MELSELTVRKLPCAKDLIVENEVISKDLQLQTLAYDHLTEDFKEFVTLTNLYLTTGLTKYKIALQELIEIGGF